MITAPTEDEFKSWQLHPVTQFVAEAYAAKAKECRDKWNDLFGRNLVPADLETQRRTLFTAEECFRSFLENTYLDFLKSADPDAWSRVAPRPKPPSASLSRSGSGF